MNRVFREEKKYLISLPEALQACHRLAQVMHEDPHNGISGYPVRSLYFDTLDDRDFREKAAGVELRRKLRLRCYDPAADFAMLEMKQKQGASQLKRSLRVTREDAQALTHGDYAPLLRYPESFAAECYALMHSRCYRPKAIVEYDRKAFIAKENKIRITFDGRSSMEPVLANMILASKVPVNILYASTKDIGGTAYGQMIIQLPEDETDAARALHYLKSVQVPYEEVNGNVI